jgi:hypothetical protein
LPLSANIIWPRDAQLNAGIKLAFEEGSWIPTN